MTLFSTTTYIWLCTALTAGVAGGSAIRDIVRMRRMRHQDRRLPVVRDELFGYWTGIVIGIVGVGGMFLYHL